jgi:hypothetical protein
METVDTASAQVRDQSKLSNIDSELELGSTEREFVFDF